MNRLPKSAHLLLLALLASLTGCTIGPNYKRPVIDAPVVYRGPSADTNANSPGAPPPVKPEKPKAEAPEPSLGDEKWWNIFQDPQLQELIRTALKNNYDLRIAATRVLQAQAQLGITRADQLPSVTAGGNITSQQSPAIGPIPAYEVTQGQLTASAAWKHRSVSYIRQMS